MTPAQQRLPRALQKAVLNLQSRIGRPGLIGMALLCASAALLGIGWLDHADLQHNDAPAKAKIAATAAIAASPSDDQAVRQLALRLPPRSDIPVLLARLQRAAQEQGLGWARAEYRTIPATPEAPAAVEVQCALKGPYPNLRGFVTALLMDTPTLTLREFALNRSGAEVAEVEAKLTIVIYVAEEAVAAGGARP